MLFWAGRCCWCPEGATHHTREQHYMSTEYIVKDGDDGGAYRYPSDDVDFDVGAAAAVVHDTDDARVDNLNLAALLRVMCKGMQFHAPLAKRALARACLQLGGAVASSAAADGAASANTAAARAAAANRLTVSIEAVGSGVVIAAALQIDRNATVSELRQLLADRAHAKNNEAVAGRIRLFVGQGGRELGDDWWSLGACGVADGATLAMVSVVYSGDFKPIPLTPSRGAPGDRIGLDDATLLDLARASRGGVAVGSTCYGHGTVAAQAIRGSFESRLGFSGVGECVLFIYLFIL